MHLAEEIGKGGRRGRECESVASWKPEDFQT